MKKLLELLFINEQGRISWTAIAAIAAIILFVHTYIDIWWLHKEYDAPLLAFALEIILVGLGVRGAQRGLQYLGEGVAGINTRKQAQQAGTQTQDYVQQQPAVRGNFKVSDFNSKDGASMPPAVQQNVLLLIDNLETIRAAIGNRPITVLSGYRSHAHNKSVGGSARSQHLLGNAADIRAKGISQRQLRKTIKKLMDAGKIEAGGLKTYNTFVHYDRRGEYVTW